MENSKNYHDEQSMINITHMREVLATLPGFCKSFFRGIQEYTSSRTRLAYAYDLRVFFEFLHDNNSMCKNWRLQNILFLSWTVSVRRTLRNIWII